MNSKLPHHHKCKECGEPITDECECSDTGVSSKLCNVCYSVLKDELEDGELEF